MSSRFFPGQLRVDMPAPGVTGARKPGEPCGGLSLRPPVTDAPWIEVGRAEQESYGSVTYCPRNPRAEGVSKR